MPALPKSPSSSKPSPVAARSPGSAAMLSPSPDVRAAAESAEPSELPWRLGDIVKDPAPVPTGPRPPKSTGTN